MEYCCRGTLAALVFLAGCDAREHDFVGAGGAGGTPDASTGVGGAGAGGSTGTSGGSSVGTGGGSSVGTSGGSSVSTSSSSVGTGDNCAVVEDCFNGADDDCDGAVDCADSDCTGGALCVKAPRNVEVGVVVNEDERCPEGFTASETLLIPRPLRRRLRGLRLYAEPHGLRRRPLSLQRRGAVRGRHRPDRRHPRQANRVHV